MGVSRQHQLHVELRGFHQAARVVRQQEGRFSGASQHTGDFVRTAGPEPDARDVEALAADGQRGALVAQYGEALGRERRRHLAVIVVIAQNGERAMGRLGERREALGHRADEAAIAVGDVIAAEYDEIRLGGGQAIDGVRDVGRRDGTAVMDVGKQADAQAVEGRRQSGNRHLRPGGRELMSLVRDAVGDDTRRESDTCRSEHFEHVAAGSAHSETVYAQESRCLRCHRAQDGAPFMIDSMSLLEEFQWRGMVYDTTEGLADVLAAGALTAYIGFDPTAASLHVGSLLPIMSLARLQRHGHTPIALVGGGTGLIGDPSGKSQERTLLTFEQVEANAQELRAQLARFLDFSAVPNAARMANNVEWLRSVGFLDFLRDVGKHFTVSAMLAKESVKRRLGAEDGISFTEFSYQLLQAYDYLVLHDRFGCTLQMGGSDQWGNITAGCELIRKVRGARVHGLVLPLVTTSAGAKFGKTEAGTVWLDRRMTSPFRFYQFWLNTDDRDVIRYLKFFTWLDRDVIEALGRTVADAPERREAQRVLAREMTSMVHGPEALEAAERATAVLFGGSVADATVEDILTVFDDVPAVTVAHGTLVDGVGVAELAVKAGVAASKGEAVRLIRQGGLYVNDRRVTDERGRVTIDDAIGAAVIVLRKGARERRIVRVDESPS